MWPNPQETADLIKFTEQILNRKLHFFAALTEMYYLPKLLWQMQISRSQEMKWI